jgi:hypothetical protein
MALLTLALMSANTPAQEIPARNGTTEKTARIVGRVLASVGSLVFGAGLGPKSITFIFGVEQSGRAIAPVKISYAFFKSQGPPPDSFFDHSKLYEFQAVRNPTCDETVDSLAYVKNVDGSGKPLPPSYVLRFLDGAPKDVLKPDAVLPCYVLRPGEYKILGQAGGAP